MNANTNANIDDFESESAPEFDFDYEYEPTPLAMAYTAAQVLYDIDCKFTQYIDLHSEPDEGYFIRSRSVSPSTEGVVMSNLRTRTPFLCAKA
ncbi:unnamed protein product [Phytophthora fragariaefolia]|uniref:Unnamed protein product n=1 Tax=Phytophthora fragariaefolia TaxID=1490495 RepID=A0A9W7CZV7_9STRA|nr:unnamed protein product [Phytophthora fragariaefolia]